MLEVVWNIFACIGIGAVSATVLFLIYLSKEDGKQHGR